MEQFQPESETCPVCGSTSNCHIHDYYARSIIDFRSGRMLKQDLCIMRVFCDSCKHAHAILPDIIIPYSSYSLFFILFILGEYFAGLHTVEQLCEHFDVSEKQFHKWLTLWKSHMEQWLGMLDASETDNATFYRQLFLRDSFSAFSMDFIRLTACSFLQSHRNPVLTRPKNARYRQTSFSPDIFLF